MGKAFSTDVWRGRVWKMNHDDLEKLLILQEKDIRIAKVKKDLESLPEMRKNILNRLKLVKQKLLELKEYIASLELQVGEVESSIASKNAYIAKTKTLQSTTRKNEEYQMCIQEIAKTEAAIEELEVRELELMEQIENAKKDFDAKMARAKEMKLEAEEKMAHLEHAAENDASSLKKMQADRAEFAAQIPADSVESYERMIKGKGLPVLVSMEEQGRCTGCHMAVPDYIRIKVFQGREIVHCPNCHRVLH